MAVLSSIDAPAWSAARSGDSTARHAGGRPFVEAREVTVELEAERAAARLEEPHLVLTTATRVGELLICEVTSVQWALWSTLLNAAPRSSNAMARPSSVRLRSFGQAFSQPAACVTREPSRHP
jgi:hypothetical protein